MNLINEDHNTSRTVRIFISSTFHDMHAERDYLVRHAFPELRARCRARQIELVEVDLRWGITRSQAESGKTLPRCLDTIHACRPYFLGLIGERYGWIPQRHEIPDWLFVDQPWLQEHLDRSVTELEILHGVLNNPNMNDRAFFFLREGRDSSTPKTTHAENPEKQDKLRRLKERLRNSPYPCRPYRTPVDLGKQVIEELWRAIDAAFPPQEVPDEFAQDEAEQRLFVASRLQVHTPRANWRSRLDAHLAATTPPLVIIGESGLGKSALLADWSETVQRTHPRLCLLRHFIGASRPSARPQNILRRWTHELQRRQGKIGELPNAPDELATTFDRLLTTTATQKPILLIIDALNQLEGDGSSDLHWLPATFPPSVRVVVSTTPGPCAAALQRRGWTLARLDPPDLALRRQMVFDHLAHYGKELEAPELNAIASAPQAANPLFLRVLLDELRITARFQNLQQLLTRYLQATDLPALFDRMLQRWERDYDPKKTGRVADPLALLAVSRRGLSEHEILELLGDRERNRPLPQARWAPFYQAASNYLIDRSGFFWFFHAHLRQAVERRYLSTPQKRCTALFRLTDYYCEQISRDHLAAGSYRALAVEVAEDALACAEATRSKRLQAKACLNASGALLGAAVGISDANVLHFNRMVELNERGCALAQQAGAKDIEADALCRRAGDETLNNPDFGRWELIDRAIELRHSRRDWAGVRDGLRDKARIGMRLNRLDITDTCLSEAEVIEQRVHDNDRQWAGIHRHQYWGECRTLQGRYPEALHALDQARRGARRFRHQGGITAATGWLGLVRCRLGEETVGLPLIRAALERERDLLCSQEGVAKWLVELGRLFVEKVEIERALSVLWLAEEIQQELQHSGLRWTTQLLAGLEEDDPQRYHTMRAAFDPFSAEFSPYCSLWGVPPLLPAEAPKVRKFSSEPLKINGLYWRLEGQENDLYAACSRDGRDWEMIRRPLMTPRSRHFDDIAISPGLLLLRPEGLLLLYGALGHDAAGRPCMAIGQALLDPLSPTRVLRRAYHPLCIWQAHSDLPPQVMGILGDGTLQVWVKSVDMDERHFVTSLKSAD